MYSKTLIYRAPIYRSPIYRYPDLQQTPINSAANSFP